MKDLTIDRQKRHVKIKGVEAAQVTQNGRVKYVDSAMQAKQDVETHMAEWIRKRTDSQL